MSRRFKTLATVFFSIIFFISCLIFILEDSVIDELLLLGFGGDTIYSERYTFESYSKIKKGDRLEEVYRVLGKPISERKKKYNFLKNGEVNLILEYSKSKSDADYRLREIHLNKDNIVVKKVSGAWID